MFCLWFDEDTQKTCWQEIQLNANATSASWREKRPGFHSPVYSICTRLSPVILRQLPETKRTQWASWHGKSFSPYMIYQITICFLRREACWLLHRNGNFNCPTSPANANSSAGEKVFSKKTGRGRVVYESIWVNGQPLVPAATGWSHWVGRINNICLGPLRLLS